MMRLLISLIFGLFLLSSQVYSQNALWVLNPQQTWYWKQGTIEEATLSIRPAGTYMEMGLYLTISSKGQYFSGNPQLESLLYFTLPDGSQVLDSWLWVGNDIVQGKILDKWTASNIYEGIVNRRRDPSILKKTGENSYELRVYPMKSNEKRKVKITYLVPANWANGKASVPLPIEILQSSKSIPALTTLVWTEEGWSDPRIPEVDEAFTQEFDYQFGNYHKMIVKPDQIVEGQLNFRMKAPMTNGYFLTTTKDQSGEGVYQLAVNFGQYLESDTYKKVAVLVDYSPLNTTISRELIFNTLQNYLLDNFTEKDSFNLFYSRFETEQYSDKWSPINMEELDEAFEALKDPFITLYNNLPGLISRGTSFVEEQNGGQIVLFSNGDNFGAFGDANGLLNDIKIMNETNIPFLIADIQNTNHSQNRIGEHWYSGQEYFYINLSRSSGGVYERLWNSSLDALYGSVFGALAGSITAFDLYSSTADGFCYGRFNQSKSESFHLDDSFVQTGKFIGEAPFFLYLTGMYQNEPFNRLIQIDEDDIWMGDTLTNKAWYGNHIMELENQPANNELVSQALIESLDNRILSIYTSFLCLEPSDTVAICTSCSDESRLTGWEDIEVLDSKLSLFPNPCTDYVQIVFNPPADWVSKEVRIQVLSVTGQVVYEAEPSIEAGVRFESRWDLAGMNGSKLARGSYWLVISNAQENYRQMLHIQ
ncbi:MAG: hypothetical protein HN352_06370 [Bacteroidetes bacterium]|jgi:hypothetical protein|nr:hypothetical protein [Bacteroidota bacterium]MBT4399000.1 hypothetical protein [Bacteroidota bacterium]MBT5425685.1 hypothetical protein [Bacteroidota bacterium]MBT7094554.1 hypothetical protein [Bacteroidota bacterium]